MKLPSFGFRQACFLALAWGLSLAAAWVMPAGRRLALAGGVGITGLIMLAFAGLGFLGFPMKGDADPRDVAAAAAGLLLGGLAIRLVG